MSENLNAIPSSSIPILSSSPSSRRSPSANSYQEDVDGLDGDSKAADSKLVKNSNHTPIYVLIWLLGVLIKFLVWQHNSFISAANECAQQLFFCWNRCTYCTPIS